MTALRLQQGSAARARWSLKIFRLGVRVLFQLVFRVRVSGLENVPPTPVIICFNHLGWTDVFLILLFFLVEPRIYSLGERQVAFIASWRTRIINWLEVFIPLDRNNPRAALRMMTDVIKRGGSLAIAPEGQLGDQEGTIGKLQNGAAYLSQTVGVPLIPVGITGSKELWLRRTLTMRVGRPIFPNEFKGDLHSRTSEMTTRLDRAMRDLLPGDMENPRVKLLSGWLTKLF